MPIRRRASSSLSVSGGAVAVDLTHVDDSITIGDTVNVMTLQDVGGVKSVPVKVLSTTGATDASLTGGTQRTKVTDGTDNVGIDTVGADKALMVSVISSVGGGSAPAETDGATFTAATSVFTPIGAQYDADNSADLADTKMGTLRCNAERALHVYNPLMEAQFTTLLAAVDGLEGYTDGLETLVTSTNTLLTTQAGYLDGLEGMTDGIETLITSTNTKLDTVIGHVDGLEALIGTTNTNTGNEATSLALIDDVIFVDDAAFTAATSKVAMIGGQYQASPNALDDGDAGSILLDSSHRVVVTVASITAGNTNIGDVDIASIAAGDNNIGNVDVVTLPAVAGGAAHDAAITGNPVPIGYRALSTTPTSVTTGDVTYPLADLAGRTITQPLAPRELVVRQNATITNTTETTILTAVASTFLDLCFLMITNTSATAVRCDFRDVTAGTVLFSVGIAANGGAVIPFPTPIPQTTVNTAWTCQNSGSVTDIRILALAVKRV